MLSPVTWREKAVCRLRDSFGALSPPFPSLVPATPHSLPPPLTPPCPKLLGTDPAPCSLPAHCSLQAARKSSLYTHLPWPWGEGILSPWLSCQRDLQLPGVISVLLIHGEGCGASSEGSRACFPTKPCKHSLRCTPVSRPWKLPRGNSPA